VSADARADHAHISWAEIVGHAVRIDRTGPLGNPSRLRDPNDERGRAEVIARCAAEHLSEGRRPGQGSVPARIGADLSLLRQEASRALSLGRDRQ
jgi:hypothetical protein